MIQGSTRVPHTWATKIGRAVRNRSPKCRPTRLIRAVKPHTRFTTDINLEGKVALAKYLISFPNAAMVAPAGELESVGRDARAVIDEAKAAGVYVFAGGIDESVPPALVSADGAVAEGGYPWAPPLDGGFTVLELPSRKEAVAWAARLANACGCAQELRVFGFDPQS